MQEYSYYKEYITECNNTYIKETKFKKNEKKYYNKFSLSY